MAKKTRDQLAAELDRIQAEEKSALEALEKKRAKLGLKMLEISKMSTETSAAAVTEAVNAALASQADTHKTAMAQQAQGHAEEIAALTKAHEQALAEALAAQAKAHEEAIRELTATRSSQLRDAVIGTAFSVAAKKGSVPATVIAAVQYAASAFQYQDVDIGWPEARSRAIEVLDRFLRSDQSAQSDQSASSFVARAT